MKRHVAFILLIVCAALLLTGCGQHSIQATILSIDGDTVVVDGYGLGFTGELTFSKEFLDDIDPAPGDVVSIICVGSANWLETPASIDARCWGKVE